MFGKGGEATRNFFIVKIWKDKNLKYLWTNIVWEEQHPEDFQLSANFSV